MEEDSTFWRKVTYTLYQYNFTVGEIATITGQSPAIIEEQLNWYVEMGFNGLKPIRSKENAMSVAEYQRNYRLDTIINTWDIFEDEPDPELRDQYRDEWIFNSIDKIVDEHQSVLAELNL